jgi:hypothetical protein
MSSGKITLINVYSVAPIIMPEPHTPGYTDMPILTDNEISRKAAREFGNRILQDGEQRAVLREFKSKRSLLNGILFKKLYELLMTAIST